MDESKRPKITLDILAANSSPSTNSTLSNLSQSGSFSIGDFFTINQNGFQFTPRGVSSNDDEASSSIKRKNKYTFDVKQKRARFNVPEDEEVNGTELSKTLRKTTSKTSSNDEQTISISSLKHTDIKVLDTIGHGASAVVQRVLHSPDNRIMALKVMHVDPSDTKLKQLLAELETLVKAKCPQIVSFFGAFYKDGAMSIALEYMDAGSLSSIRSKIDGNRIEEKYLAKISSEILKGIEYLHKKARVIHRDIKPSNILLNTKGQVKIADFGVSSGQLNNTIDAKNTFVGTVTYMSPERLECKGHSFDSDIWSFGLMIMECIMGYFPYRPASGNSSQYGFWDAMDKIVAGPVPKIPDNIIVSDEFRSFIDLSLKKNPSERVTATELLLHPWIKKYDDVKLSDWIQQIPKKKQTLQCTISGGLQGLKSRCLASPVCKSPSITK